jgi:general secretion pathway protein D
VVKIPLLGDIPVLGALFRSTNDSVDKDNLVLVLTPHIIRNEDDMREIFEKRMQERQEFLDHYFVFRDGPPIGFDPKHGRGVLAELRASYLEVADRRRLESQVPQTVVASHDPRPPLDMPSTAVGVAAAQGSAPPVAQPASLHVAGPTRTIDRVEK